jgi:hypothetical protein
MSEIRDQWPGSADFTGLLGPFIVKAYDGDRAAEGSPHPCCAHCTHLERLGHRTPCPRCPA